MEENSIINENIVEDIAEGLSAKNVYLPSGKALSPTETYLVTASEKSRFVVLLGAVGSGKTAICTSIYSHFLDGKFEGEYYFAGSNTLAAFEEYAYSTRTVSARSLPAHERTKRETKNVLHIRLNELLKKSCENYLIADFSGEDYENIICNVNQTKDEFQVIKSATIIVVVIDGEKMCKASTRTPEIQQSINLLHTIYDAKLISNSIPIIIVVSKFDLVQHAEVANWRELIMEKFSDQLPDLKKNFSIKEVAPLSKYTDITSVGHGIKTFFDETLLKKNKMATDIRPPNTNSQFENWGRRMLPDEK